MIAKNVQLSGNKKELVKSVLPGLPISLFSTEFSPRSYNYVNWHWHDAFQYCLVTEGTVDFILPKKSYTITKGDGIFINYQQLHLIRAHDAQSRAAYICLDIPPFFISYDKHSRIYQRYLQPIIDHPDPPAVILSKCSEGPARIMDSILHIQQLLKSGEEFMEIDIRIAAMEIWKLTFRRLKQSTAVSSASYLANDRLKSIISYIHEHFDEKLTLDDIAVQVSLSRSECSRFFKKTAGQSLFEYLNDYRLSKSIDMLRDTDLSIAQIADASGFCNQSYYTDAFRKKIGLTPRRFRELSTRRPDQPSLQE